MRSENIKSVGKRLDANLLDSENGIDKYFTSEQEKTDVTGLVGTAQSTATVAQATANAAQTSANTAQATANAAQTTANNAALAASGAQDTANIANSTLAGSTNFFKGTVSTNMNGTPNLLVLKDFSTKEKEGIDITAGGYFNFSYLGDYLLSVKMVGDGVNGFADWYRYVDVDVKNEVTGEIIHIYYKNLPPSYSIGIHGACPPSLLRVNAGDQWKVRLTATGITLSATSAVIHWSKVV